MNRRLIVASLAVLATVAALVVNELERQKVYDLGVSDFLERDLRDHKARIHGNLVPGSLCRIQPDCGYRFSLTDPLLPPSQARVQGAHALPVSFEGCLVPDSFLEHPEREHEVYVVGERCQTCHHFQATSILARTYSGLELLAPPAPLPPLCDPPRM